MGIPIWLSKEFTLAILSKLVQRVLRLRQLEKQAEQLTRTALVISSCVFFFMMSITKRNPHTTVIR